MKIGIFTDHFYPELGGIQDSIEECSRELARRGHTIHIWAPAASSADFAMLGRAQSELDLGPNVVIHRRPSVLFPLSTTRQSRIALPLIFADRDILASCDIIHTHSSFSIGLSALGIARSLKKPIVGTNHWAIAEFGGYFPPPFNQLFARTSLSYLNWYFSHCAFMSAPSASTLTEQLATGFAVPTDVVSNPIDIVTYHPPTAEERNSARARFGFTGPIITCVGRLAVEKKNDITIRAFAQTLHDHPDATLVFAGHGIAEESLHDLAAELGVSNSVQFLGTLAKTDLAALLRASDIYAIASTSETQSMSLLQAFATALPTVGVDWRAIPNYLSTERGFLFPKDDAGAMSKHFNVLISDAPLRERLGKNAAQYVQTFSTARIATHWEDIYTRILRAR